MRGVTQNGGAGGGGRWREKDRVWGQPEVRRVVVGGSFHGGVGDKGGTSSPTPTGRVSLPGFGVGGGGEDNTMANGVGFRWPLG